MKPKTKLQKEIHDLVFKLDENYGGYRRSHKNIPEISKAQMRYAEKHCLDHVAFLSKGGTLNCMDCGHSWKTEKPNPGCDWHHEVTKGLTKCPNCKVALDIKVTQNRKVTDSSNLEIITTCKGFQVIRYFEIFGYSKTKEKKRIQYYERFQIWIAANGKHEVIGNLRSYYIGSFHGSFELRQKNTVGTYNIKAYKRYPKVLTIPEIDRNGFYGKFLGIKAFDFFKAILCSTHAETLLKNDQFKMFEHMANMKHETTHVVKYWPSIKIAIRNNYNIVKPRDYIDYLGLLESFNRDLKNPKYICPRDFDLEHNRYVEKMRVKRKKQQLADRLKRDKEAIVIYEKHILKFSELQFKTSRLLIRPLMTLEEIKDAGDKLHHCIYSSSYYTKTDSLLMCAYDGDSPIETIQIDLMNFKISQSRGLQNNPTSFHQEIINTVNANMRLIENILKSKRKTKKKL